MISGSNRGLQTIFWKFRIILCFERSAACHECARHVCDLRRGRFESDSSILRSEFPANPSRNHRNLMLGVPKPILVASNSLRNPLKAIEIYFFGPQTYPSSLSASWLADRCCQAAHVVIGDALPSRGHTSAKV